MNKINLQEIIYHTKDLTKLQLQEPTPKIGKSLSRTWPYGSDTKYKKAPEIKDEDRREYLERVF